MKTKSKSLISIILSIMMVLSMIIVAVPVNAATVDTDTVGATNYYIWYNKTNSNAPSTYTGGPVTMTEENGLYVGYFNSTTNMNIYFTITTNSSSPTSNGVWSSKPTVSISSDFSWANGQYGYYGNGNYGLVETYVKNGTASKIKVVYNASTKAVTLSIATDTPTTYTVSKSSTSNGSFTVDKTSAASGATVTINTTPISGYQVNTVTVTKTGGGTVSVATSTANSKYTFIMPASNVTVAVTFKQIPVTNWYISGFLVRPNGSSNETIPCADSQFKMTQSTSNSNLYTLTYTISGSQYYTVNDGTNVYHPANDGAASGTVASSTTDKNPGEKPSWHALNLPAGTTITLTWNASTKALSWTTVSDSTSYNITVSSADNGVLSCATTSAKAGTTVTFTATPNDGYVIDKVTVTGATVSQNGTTFTFTMPAQNVTISATFKVVTTVTSKWSLVGDFNDWVETDNPMKNSSGTYTTTIYLPANSTGYDFKILNNQPSSGEHAFYGKLNTNYTDTISGAVLDNGDSVPETGNIVFKTNGGVYTFKFVESTKTLTVTKASTYTLTATGTIPSTIGVGEDLNMTINAVPSANFPTTAYYKYTVKAGALFVAKGVQHTNTAYNCKKTLSADSTITYFVKAYNASGELIGLTATGSQAVTVTVSDFTVDLKVDTQEIVKGSAVTLTATVTPASYAKSYEFFQSTDGESFTSLGTASASNTKKVTLSTVGTYYFKVKVVNNYDTSNFAESYRINVNVYETLGKHNVDIYFKSASSFIYAPTLACNGGSAQAMTKDTFIGNAYSGSLKYYWYKLTVQIDSSVDNKITFKTGRTQVNASYTGRFYGNEYYFAVDNLMSDTKVYDLTTAAPYIRNFYHSPLNMVTLGDVSDANLGFTNIKGETHKMGSLLTTTVDETGAVTVSASFTIKSATAAQKVSAELEEVSDLQYDLFDVNLDGNVDVRDATLMQKALAYA